MHRRYPDAMRVCTRACLEVLLRHFTCDARYRGRLASMIPATDARSRSRGAVAVSSRRSLWMRCSYKPDGNLPRRGTAGATIRLGCRTDAGALGSSFGQRRSVLLTGQMRVLREPE
jgi:hypothetical protein